MSKPDYWTEGYRAALGGAVYGDNPHEGGQGASAWAFGCSEGMKERNRRSFLNLISAIRAVDM